MKWLSQIWRRLRFWSRRGRLQNELDEELRFHLEMQAAQNRDAGMSPEDAGYAARRRLGNRTRVVEESRAAWGWRALDDLGQDLRYAVRTLRNSPGFTAVVTLTLALAIGANVSIFSLVDRLLLRPLPFPESGRLMAVEHRGGDYNSDMSYPDYEYYRDRNPLVGLAGYTGVSAEFRFGALAEELLGEIVTWNFFDVLGAQPVLGRSFREEEDRVPGEGAVVVLSHSLWQRRFGADPGVLGRTVTLNRRVFTIVGVARRGFAGVRLERPAPPEFWVPTMMYGTVLSTQDLKHYWGNHWLKGIARLKPGVTPEQAGAAFARLSAELRDTHWKQVWEKTGTWTARLSPAAQAERKALSTPLGLPAAAVGAVFLIACLNIANLLLARAAARQREIAVRLAIGAGRARLVRQLVTEGVVLALLGGAAAIAVAAFTSSFVARLYPPFRLPLLGGAIDLRVLGFALALSSLTGVLFGLVPAQAASRLALNSALHAQRAEGGRLRRLSARQLLVAGQAAVAVLLLVAAGLFVRTLINARAADITVDAGKVLLAPVDLKLDDRRGRLAWMQILERVASLPGVRGSALVYIVPFGGRRGGTNVVIERKPIQIDFNAVSPDYFRAIGIPVVRGRAFTAADRDGAPGVAIVNEVWARRFWPGRDPIGQRIETTRDGLVEVVGVVRDGKFRNYRADVYPCMYLPAAQHYSARMNLEVRVEANPLALVPAITREILGVEPQARVSAMRTLEAHRDAGLTRERLAAALLTALGALALVVASVGLYGVMSYSVARRTREIGLRLALGAHAGATVRMVIAQGLALTACGLAAGLAAAAALTRLVEAQLYGVRAIDPVTFASMALVLVAAALAACYIPARRAARVDPMIALRHE